MFSKRTSLFTVAVHLRGRHPYLHSNELDFEDRDVVMTIPAKNWNDAERQALNAAMHIPDKWGARVTSIARTSGSD